MNEPIKSKCWDGSKGSRILFQGRAGVINVEKRKQKWDRGSNGKCKVCREDSDETIDHMLTWCSAYGEQRGKLFEGWKERDRQCKSLEQVKNMTENERLAWILGMKGDFPGSIAGLESVKSFLLHCWESRSNMIEMARDEDREAN